MPLPRAIRPFARAQYRLLALGLGVALLADGQWLIASVWQVVRLGGSQADLSIVATALAVGMLASALAGGVLADRFPQRNILLSIEVTKMVIVAACALLAQTGNGTIWQLAVAGLAMGAGSGLYYPAYTALLPTIVPPSELQAANGLEALLRPAMMQAAGPAVAGVIVATWSPAAAMWTTAALLGLAAVALLRLRSTPVEREASADRHPVRAVIDDVVQGVRYMMVTPWLLATLLFASVMLLAMMGPIEVLTPFVIKDRLGGGPTEHAWVLAAFGVGGAAGSLVVASLPTPRRYLTIMMLGWGAGCLPLVVFGIADSLWPMIVASFVTGAMTSAPMVIWGTLLQRRVPSKLLGRVASLDFFVSMSLMPVSMALAGPVSLAIGMTATFWIAGTVPLVIAVIAIVAARMPADEIANPLRDEVVAK